MSRKSCMRCKPGVLCETHRRYSREKKHRRAERRNNDRNNEDEQQTTRTESHTDTDSAIMFKSQVWVAALQSSMKDMNTHLQSIHASLEQCDDRNETAVHVAALKEKVEKHTKSLDTHAAHFLHVSTRLAASEAKTELAKKSENEANCRTDKPAKHLKGIGTELEDIENRLEGFEDVHIRHVAATTGKLSGRLTALEDNHLVYVADTRGRVASLELLDRKLAARIAALERNQTTAQIANVHVRVATLEMREATSTRRITTLEKDHSAAHIANLCARVASLEAGTTSIEAKQDTSLGVAAAPDNIDPTISHTEEPEDPLSATDRDALADAEIDKLSGKLLDEPGGITESGDELQASIPKPSKDTSGDHLAATDIVEPTAVGTEQLEDPLAEANDIDSTVP